MNQLKEFLQEHQSCVETALDAWLPAADIQPEHLHEAMRYSVLSDGKRIRPVLVYAAGNVFAVNRNALDAPACAVEMIHAYSLIHDDLPAMDDDDLRRGRPTCHRAYDEATAILAGDSLQALAFHVLANDSNMIIDAEQRIQMINILAHASGSRGMAGGQAIDLDAARRKPFVPRPGGAKEVADQRRRGDRHMLVEQDPSVVFQPRIRQLELDLRHVPRSVVFAPAVAPV